MDNKSKILDIAMKLFSDKGYDGTGIQEIVDKSEITKPTLYYYFGSKEGILKAIFQKYYDPFLESLERVCDIKNDITLSITEVFRAFFAYAQENPVFFRLSSSATYVQKDNAAHLTIEPYIVRINAILNKMFKSAGEYHGNMKGREKEYALSLLGTINAYLFLIINEELDPNEEVIYKAVRQFMYGIFS